MSEGDILWHEPMGIVEEVGPAITNVGIGDRVVIPFNVSRGHCYMCRQGLMSQCEPTQVRAEGKGAALLEYTRLYGQVPGGQAEYLRVPQGQFGPIVVPDGPPDDRFVYLSNVLPTAWQAVEYAAIPTGGSVLVLGLGPIGDMATRVARHRGAGRIVAVDLVSERLARARDYGVEALDLTQHDDIADVIRDLTDGRGPGQCH
jgi:threonine dehydrogenase-like Zn-dependent dehydrogenase